MHVMFGNTDKARNSTKEVGLSDDRECLLKDPVSVESPVLLVKTDTFPAYNYCFIPEFARYYYITDITSYNAHMWHISCEVDVLLTYKAQILATDAFVMYAQSDYNTMIPDTRIPMVPGTINNKFEYEFGPYLSSGCYAISVASASSSGSSGMAQVYILTNGGMSALAKKFGDRDFIKEVSEYFADPLNTVIRAVWYPLDPSKMGYGSSPIQLGDFDTGVSGAMATPFVNFQVEIPIELPYRSQLPNGGYTYADYRNVEPYTSYAIELPGMGMFSLPMTSLIGDGTVKPTIVFDISIDPSTGDIVYRMEEDENPIMVLTGNLAVEVPLFNGANNPGVLSGVAQILGGIGTTAVSAVVGSPISAAYGIASLGKSVADTFLTSQQTNYTISGKLGGHAGWQNAAKIRLTVLQHSTSESPAIVGATIGRPLFANRRMGSMRGYIFTKGAHIQCEATLQEHDMLTQFFENSRNDYGGVIIE